MCRNLVSKDPFKRFFPQDKFIVASFSDYCTLQDSHSIVADEETVPVTIVDCLDAAPGPAHCHAPLLPGDGGGGVGVDIAHQLHLQQGNISL